VRAATIIKQNTRIQDSLNYAKKIQQTLLPPISEMSIPFNDIFVFYEAKGIVSGDFYWCKHYGGKTLLVCADCIGHKVIGGLLSTMGGLIIDNVVQKGFNKPSELLTQISDDLIRLLRQDEGGGIQEGMGMSVCVIDHASNSIEFSGARNGIILVRDGKSLRHKGGFYFVGGKFDKNGQKIERKFNDHVIDYHKNDWLYMYTDGYLEQLGGNKGGPIGFKRFEQYISALSSIESLEAKKLFFKSKLDDWKGREEQLDDLLVMGFQLT
jgi:serine phosphatase RsbU (regulator of sigma subunit)